MQAYARDHLHSDDEGDVDIQESTENKRSRTDEQFVPNKALEKAICQFLLVQVTGLQFWMTVSVVNL